MLYVKELVVTLLILGRKIIVSHGVGDLCTILQVNIKAIDDHIESEYTCYQYVTKHFVFFLLFLFLDFIAWCCSINYDHGVSIDQFLII